jgi:hypothetical protein
MTSMKKMSKTCQQQCCNRSNSTNMVANEVSRIMPLLLKIPKNLCEGLLSVLR